MIYSAWVKGNSLSSLIVGYMAQIPSLQGIWITFLITKGLPFSWKNNDFHHGNQCGKEFGLFCLYS